MNQFTHIKTNACLGLLGLLDKVLKEDALVVLTNIRNQKLVMIFRKIFRNNEMLKKLFMTLLKYISIGKKNVQKVLNKNLKVRLMNTEI